MKRSMSGDKIILDGREAEFREEAECIDQEKNLVAVLLSAVTSRELNDLGHWREDEEFAGIVRGQKGLGCEVPLSNCVQEP